MSNVSQEAPVTGAAGVRGILSHVGAFLVLLAFALLAFAHLSNATESEMVPAAAPTDGKTVEVAISNFTFTPNELTIAPGTTVKWVNHDDSRIWLPRRLSHSNRKRSTPMTPSRSHSPSLAMWSTSACSTRI